MQKPTLLAHTLLSKTEVKESYEAGSYLMNPLKLPFNKVFLTHVIVMKWTLVLLKNCCATAEMKTKPHNFRSVGQQNPKQFALPFNSRASSSQDHLRVAIIEGKPWMY